MDIINILNTIRDNSSAMYQERVPEADGTNWKDLQAAVLSEAALRNEFCGAVVQLAFMEISGRKFTNPLAVLKTGRMPFGRFVQDVHVNPAEGTEFDGFTTDDLLSQSRADVVTVWYGKESKRKYKVTISYARLQDALTGDSQMTTLISWVKQSMYSGDEMDEFQETRALISDAVKENKIKTYEVDWNADEQSSKDLVKLINTISLDMREPSTEFNGYNLLNKAEIEAGTVNPRITWCPSENQILLIRNDVDVNTDVEVLAKAFNMSKTEFLQRKINVSHFGDKDTLCVLCDEALFRIYDRVYTVEDFRNGSNLTTNFYLHHWQNMDLALFANAVAFKAKAQA